MEGTGVWELEGVVSIKSEAVRICAIVGTEWCGVFVRFYASFVRLCVVFVGKDWTDILWGRRGCEFEKFTIRIVRY